MRIFHDLLKRVGDEGPYQRIIMLMNCLMLSHSGISVFAISFLFHQQEYVCPAHVLHYNHYVCSLPAQARAQYIPTGFSSLLGQFGDFRCEDGAQLAKVRMLVFSGGVLGVAIGTKLMPWLTHRGMLILTLAVGLFGLVLTLLSWNEWVAGVGLFLVFATASMQRQVMGSFVTQTLSQNLRMKCLLMGVGFFAAAFWVISGYVLVMLFLQILPVMILLYLFLFIINETPMELVTRNTPKHSHQVLSRIANINRHHFDGTIQEIAAIKSEYFQNEVKKQSSAVTVTDLFRFKSLRLVTVIMIFLRFFISYEFHAPLLYLEDFAINIYLNAILICIGEAVGSVLCFPLDKMPRRVIMWVTQAVGGAICLYLVFFTACTNSSDCPQRDRVVQTVGLFVFRIITTISYNYFFVIKTESFPTQIRVIALNLTSIAANSAFLTVPFLQYCFEVIEVSLIVTFFVTCVLFCGLLVPLKEALGTPPSEMIKELNYQQGQVNQPDNQKQFQMKLL